MSDLLIRSASLTPQTANPENRTVEVVWSTGAGVRRRDMNGEYIERLSLEASAVDLSRLLGASVLDAHRQGAVRDVLGAVRNAQVDGKQGTALLQFSARAEVEPIWQDVLGGIVRHVSVGYTVQEWKESLEKGIRTFTATRWTPIEISLVPTPADPGATIRMEEQHMTDKTTATQEAAPGAVHLPLTATQAYPLEVKREALAMQDAGQPNRVIGAFILEKTGRKPDSKNMGALLKQWRKALSGL